MHRGMGHRLDELDQDEDRQLEVFWADFAAPSLEVRTKPVGHVLLHRAYSLEATPPGNLLGESLVELWR